MRLASTAPLPETLPFGSLLVFSIYALASFLLAGQRVTFKSAWNWDVIGLGIGLFITIGIMHSHKLLFGVAAI